MKLIQIITHPLTLTLSFCFLLISGEAWGGFYLSYILMALPHGGLHALLAVGGGVMMGAGYRLQVTGCRLPEAGSSLQYAGGSGQDAGSSLQYAGGSGQDAGERLQGAGYRLQVARCRWGAMLQILGLSGYVASLLIFFRGDKTNYNQATFGEAVPLLLFSLFQLLALFFLVRQLLVLFRRKEPEPVH